MTVRSRIRGLNSLDSVPENNGRLDPGVAMTLVYSFPRDGRGFSLRAAIFGGGTAATGRGDLGLYHRLRKALSPLPPSSVLDVVLMK